MDNDYGSKEYSRLTVEQGFHIFNKSIGCLWLSIAIVQVCLIRVISSNIYYIDDMTRTVSGSGWNIVGRPLSSIIMQFLSGDILVQDLSPLTQISGTIIVTLAAYILSLSFCREESLKFLRILFTLIIALNPYLLEIYSYRYDSLPYAIGFFFAVAAHTILFDFSLATQSNKRMSIFMSLAGAAFCLCTGTLFYQPVITVFLVSGTSKLFVFAISNRTTGKNGKLLAAFILTIAASLLTAKIAKNILIGESGWAEGQGKFTPSQAYANLYFNTIKAWKIFLNDWTTPQNIFFLFFLLTLFSVVIMVLMHIFNNLKKSDSNRIKAKQYLFSTIILLAGGILGLYGITAILDNPHMKPRTFIALGVTVAIPLLLPYPLGLAKNLFIKKYLNLVGMTGALSVVIFSLIWGNAMSAQNMHQNSINWQLGQDIYSLKKSDGKVNFENTIGFSPLISTKTLDKYPLLQRLLGRHPSFKWSFGYIGLRTKTGLKLNAADSCPSANYDLLIDRINYTIVNCDSNLIVSFK